MSDGHDAISQRFNTVSCDMVVQEIDRIDAKSALGGVYHESMSSQSLEQLAKVLLMFSRR